MGAAVRAADKAVGGGGKIILRGVGFVWLRPFFAFYKTLSYTIVIVANLPELHYNIFVRKLNFSMHKGR